MKSQQAGICRPAGSIKSRLASHSSNGILLYGYKRSKTDIYKKYPWAYFGSVQQPDNKYIETLQIDSNENKKELFRYSKPAIVKGIETIDGAGSVDGGRLFSPEEQFDLFIDAYTSFGDTMDFTDLISYFQQLSDSYDPDISRGKSRR